MNDTKKEKNPKKQGSDLFAKPEYLQPTAPAPYPLFQKNHIMKPTKIKTSNSLSYRNIPAALIPMLRLKLNEDQPAWNENTELQRAPPSNKTSSSSCSFQAGSFTTMEGTCSKYGRCRVDKLEYVHHVRNIAVESLNVYLVFSQPSCHPPPLSPNTICMLGASHPRQVHGHCNKHGHCVAQHVVRWVTEKSS